MTSDMKLNEVKHAKSKVKKEILDEVTKMNDDDKYALIKGSP